MTTCRSIQARERTDTVAGRRRRPWLVLPVFAAVLAAFTTGSAMASTAYGDLNNFDVFNDTGVESHGF